MPLIVKIDDKAVAAIEAVLKKGNRAVVQRRGQSIIVMEEERKIRYDTDSSGNQERAI